MKKNVTISVTKRTMSAILAFIFTVSGMNMYLPTNEYPSSVSNSISISASAANLYVPSLSGGNYIAGYCLSDSSIPVYTTSALTTRGAATSKNGGMSSYNAYVSGKSDEIRIYQFTSSYCYIGYPTSSGAYKYGYVKTSDITSLASTANAIISKAKITTYKKQNLDTSYGYIAKGDTIYLISKSSGNNYQLIYNTGSNWKIGWVNSSGYASITGSTTNNTNATVTYTGYVNTSSANLILRQTPAASGKQIASMPKGSTLTVLDNKQQTSGFYHISYNGTNGYASSSYISFTKPATQTNSSTYTGYVNTSSANLILRQTPAASGKQIASMPKGSTLTVLDNKQQISGFYHVSYNGTNGYASSSYISFTKPTQTNLSYGLYKNSSAKITCGFDGYVNTKGKHEGIDISLGVGKPIYSLTDGVITNVVYGSRGSNGLSTIAVYVASQNKTVVYLHATPLSSLKIGQAISKGQQLGSQDWRGISSSSSSHTHVEVRTGKKTLAAKSVNDYTLDNSNPTSFWNSMGYTIK